jgi:hypothetical protein
VNNETKGGQTCPACGAARARGEGYVCACPLADRIRAVCRLNERGTRAGASGSGGNRLHDDLDDLDAVMIARRSAALADDAPRGERAN